MAHHEEPPTSDTTDQGPRHKDKDEPEPRSHDSEVSSDESSHRGAVGGALIGGVVDGAHGLVGGALLGSLLDDEDAE